MFSTMFVSLLLDAARGEGSPLNAAIVAVS